MKSRVVRTAFISSASALAALLLAACTGALVDVGPDPSTDGPPTAARQDELFGGVDDAGQPCWWLPTCWFPHRELSTGLDPYRGSPAWAADGSDADVAVVEAAYLRRVSFPPLQGWWDRRDFSFRVFVTEPGSTRRIYLHDAPLRGHASELFWMKAAGYALVRRHDDLNQRNEVLRLDAVDGTVATVSTLPLEPFGFALDVIPSPDGATLAEIVCQTHTLTPTPEGTFIDALHPTPCTVRFLDATTLAPLTAAPPQTLLLPEDPPFVPYGDASGARELARATWTTAGTLVLTDWSATAFELSPMTPATPVPVPTCRGPVTTSGQVSTSGQRIGVSGKRVVPVAAVPGVADAFGCP